LHASCFTFSVRFCVLLKGYRSFRPLIRCRCCYGTLSAKPSQRVLSHTRRDLNCTRAALRHRVPSHTRRDSNCTRAALRHRVPSHTRRDLNCTRFSFTWSWAWVHDVGHLASGLLHPACGCVPPCCTRRAGGCPLDSNGMISAQVGSASARTLWHNLVGHVFAMNRRGNVRTHVKGRVGGLRSRMLERSHCKP
jgi:hypothetical protein